jgi:hypothetical protein
MTEPVDHRTSIHAIFEVGGNLIVNEGDRLTTRGKALPIELINSYRFGRGLICIISSGQVDIYDGGFSLLRSHKDKRITSENTGVEAFTSDDFAIFRFIETNELEVFLGGKKVSEIKDFWGKVISPSVRVNFKPGTFKNPDYFRCSDLADGKTFFEFTCQSGQEIIPNFVLRDDKLFFPLLVNGNIQLIALEVTSGKILWQSPADSATFNMDESQSTLVSFTARTNANGKGRYQIVDLITPAIEVGDTSDLLIDQNIYTPQHFQYLYGNHIYFADNRHSFSGKKLTPVRFGRMNITTKEIDLLQEVTASPKSPISEIVEHDGHVYVRNLDNELFTYKLKNS